MKPKTGRNLQHCVELLGLVQHLQGLGLGFFERFGFGVGIFRAWVEGLG